MKPFHSGLPLTEAERAQTIEDQRLRALKDAMRRRSTPSKTNYQRKPTPADKALSRRILGERDDGK